MFLVKELMLENSGKIDGSKIEIVEFVKFVQIVKDKWLTVSIVIIRKCQVL